MSRGFLVLGAVLAGGCSESFPPADAGSECLVAGYQACGGGCPTRCDFGLCFEQIGLCLPSAGGRPCAFRTSPPEGISTSPSCPFGWACWFDGSETPANGEEGVNCVPPDMCLLAPPDVPAHRCFWSDGNEVTRVPPADECPNYDDIYWTTCGAPACGEVANLCSLGTGGSLCAGVSDQRGFGVCQFGDNACDPANRAHTDLCTMFTDLPCACMVTGPRAPTTIEPWGFLVSLEACERYAARFPGQVECVVPP